MPAVEHFCFRDKRKMFFLHSEKKQVFTRPQKDKHVPPSESTFSERTSTCFNFFGPCEIVDFRVATRKLHRREQLMQLILPENLAIFFSRVYRTPYLWVSSRTELSPRKAQRSKPSPVYESSGRLILCCQSTLKWGFRKS